MSESPKSPIIKGRRSKKRDMEAEIIPATPEKLQPKSLFKVRWDCQKKNGIFWEFFPKGGGGHPISQNFCKITKSFLACQIHPKVLKHVFHTGGSNI